MPHRSSSLSSSSMSDGEFRSLLRRNARSPTPPSRRRRKNDDVTPHDAGRARGRGNRNTVRGRAKRLPGTPPPEKQALMVSSTESDSAGDEDASSVGVSAHCGPLGSSIVTRRLDGVPSRAGSMWCEIGRKYSVMAAASNPNEVVFMPKTGSFRAIGELPLSAFALRLAERFGGIGAPPATSPLQRQPRPPRGRGAPKPLRGGGVPWVDQLSVTQYPTEIPRATMLEWTELVDGDLHNRLSVASPRTGSLITFPTLPGSGAVCETSAPVNALLADSVYAVVPHPRHGLLFTGPSRLAAWRTPASPSGAATLVLPRVGELRCITAWGDGVAAGMGPTGSLIAIPSWGGHEPMRLEHAFPTCVADATSFGFPDCVLVGQRNGRLGIVDLRATPANPRKPLHILGQMSSTLQQIEPLARFGNGAAATSVAARSADGAVAVYDLRRGSRPRSTGLPKLSQEAVHELSPAIGPTFLDLNPTHGRICPFAGAGGRAMVGLCSGLNRVASFCATTGETAAEYVVDGCTFATQVGFGHAGATNPRPSFDQLPARITTATAEWVATHHMTA